MKTRFRAHADPDQTQQGRPALRTSPCHTAAAVRSVPGLLLLLLACGTGCQQIEWVGGRLKPASDILSGNNAGRYARLMESESSADQRRKGISRLAEYDFARKPPYTTRYRQIAKNDEDYVVRAAAVRALNRARDREATQLYIDALTDPSELVRMEAAKALKNMPDPAAAGPLLDVVNKPDENRDVRIAAAEALRHYRRLDVARGLVDRLDERDFGVAWQARRSLRTITKRDFGYDEGAWLEYLTGPETPLG